MVYGVEVASCSNCGSPTQTSKGPGRMRTYLGQPGFEIPADLEFEVCESCGAEWLTASQIDQLSDAFEAQRGAV